MIPPLVSYTPVTVSGGPTGVLEASNTKSSQDLTDKDILEMLEKLDGLPSDMGMIFKSLQNFYIDLSLGINTSSIASKYLLILNSMKNANFNKKEYDSAFDIVKANGGLNEIAINDRGLIFCTNKEGDFLLLSPEEVKNSDYVPLTNSELLQYRAHHPEMAYKNNILKVVSNGIGIETVTKMLQLGMLQLGITSTTREGYVRTEAVQVLNGLELFMEAAKKTGNYNATVDNLFKGKLLTESQAMLALQALYYMYRTLPQNAKSLLKTKTANGTDEEAVDLVSQLLQSKLSNKSQFTMSMESPDKGSSKKGDGSDIEKGFKLDPVSLLLAGKGLKEKAIIQTGKGKDMGIEIPAVKMSITKDKKAVGSLATLADITESDFGGTFDWSNATVGNIGIKTSAFDLVLVDGNSLRAAYLPIDIEAYTTDGTIRPDIDMLGRYKDALKEIEEKNVVDPMEINKIYQSHRLPIIYTPNGDVTANYIKFGILNGELLNSAVSEGAEFAEWLEEIIDSNEINNTLRILNKGRKDDNILEYDRDDMWILEGSYNNMYRGTIFIPMNTDYFTATSTAGNSVTPMLANLIEARQQAVEKAKGYVNPGNTL